MMRGELWQSNDANSEGLCGERSIQTSLKHRSVGFQTLPKLPCLRIPCVRHRRGLLVPTSCSPLHRPGFESPSRQKTVRLSFFLSCTGGAQFFSQLESSLLLSSQPLGSIFNISLCNFVASSGLSVLVLKTFLLSLEW